MGWCGELYDPKQWKINENEDKQDLKIRNTVKYWGGAEIHKYIVGYENDDYAQGSTSEWVPPIIVKLLQEKKLYLIAQNYNNFFVVDKKGIVVWSDIEHLNEIAKHFKDACCCKNRSYLCYFCASFNDEKLVNCIEWDWDEPNNNI